METKVNTYLRLYRYVYINKAYKSFSENLLNRSLSVSKVGVFVNPIFIPFLNPITY